MNMLFCKVVDLSCSEGIVALAERLRFNTRSGTWILGVIFKGSILKQRTLKTPLRYVGALHPCRSGCFMPISKYLVYVINHPLTSTLVRVLHPEVAKTSLR